MARRTTLLISGLLVTLLAGQACSRFASDKASFVTSGNTFASKGQWGEAMVEYRRAIQADPLFVEARQRLADALERATPGNTQEILRERVRLAELLPNDLATQIRAGHVLADARRWDEARARALRAAEIKPESVPARLLQARIAQGRGDLEGAALFINKAIELEPHSGDAYLALGRLQAGQRQREQAEASFRKAVELQPSLAEAHLALANLYASMGRALDGQSEFLQSLKLSPQSVPAQRALADLYLSIGRAADAEAPLKIVADRLHDLPSSLALADYYLQQQRLDDSERVLKAARALPNSTLAEVRLAMLTFRRNQVADAHTALNAILSRQPGNLDAQLAKARMLMHEGRLDEARDHAKEVSRTLPGAGDAAFLVGTIETQRHDLKAAIQAFTDVLAVNPQNQAAQLQLIDLRVQQGTPESLDAAVAIARVNRKDFTTGLVLARALLRHGLVQRADDALRNLLPDHEGIARVHAAIGQLRLRQKRTADARAAFDRALAINPLVFDAFAGRVEVELAEGRLQEARTMVDERLAQAGGAPALLLLAARIAGAEEDDVQAEVLLRKALAGDPTHERTFRLLTDLHTRMGTLEKARAEFADTARQHPGSPAATMVGLLLAAEGKTAEAQQSLEAVLAAAPANGVAASVLARLYLNDPTRLDAALALARRARLHLPNAAEPADTLGLAYLKKGQFALAVPHLEAAVSIDPTLADAFRNLAQAYGRLGNEAAARAASEEAGRLSASAGKVTQAAAASAPQAKLGGQDAGAAKTAAPVRKVRGRRR